MKIIYFCDASFQHTENIGGHVSHVIGVIEAFRNLGYEVAIASPGDIPYINMDEYTHIKLPSTHIQVPKIGTLLREWKVINTVLRYIPAFEPHFIYARWPNNIFFKRIRKRYPRLPILLECNTPFTMGKKKKIISKRMNSQIQDKQNITISSIISAVSDTVRLHLVNTFNSGVERKVFTNPNGVNVEKFKPMISDLREEFNIDENIPIIGFSGHFHTWHRIDILIKAVQSLTLDFRLLIIGRGENKLENELRDLAKYKYSDKIIFTGSKAFTKIPEYLSICDILVVPQDKDQKKGSHGSPLKLFEYMAMGKAIAAANVGQIPTIIKNGDNGILFEPDPKNLADVLKCLIEDEGLRNRLGIRAREDVVRQYSWEANVSRILNAMPSSS